MHPNRLILRKSQLISWLLIIAWFPPAVVIDTYSIWFNLFKIAICGYVIAKGLFLKHTEYRYGFVWVYFLVLLYSTYLQGNIRNLMAATVYSIGIISMFYYFRNRQLIAEMKNMFPMSSAYLVINTASIFIFREGITQNALGQANYFIGSKFTVFYLFVFWIFQFMIVKKVKKWQLIALISVQLFISYMTDCSTAMFSLAVLFILIYFDVNKTIIYRPIPIAALIIGSNVFLILYNSLLSTGAFSYIIEKVLNRNLNLTGRTEIYNTFFVLLGNNLMLGKGYNNTLIESTLGYLNTQNGFLNIISSVGVIGMIPFVIVLLFAFVRSHKCGESYFYKEHVWPFVLTFFVAALVEISFNAYFFFLVAICMAAPMEKKQTNCIDQQRCAVEHDEVYSSFSTGRIRKSRL